MSFPNEERRRRWPPDPEAASAGEDGFAPIYAVHLLYETAPPIDRGALLAATGTLCGEIDDIGTPGDPHVAGTRLPRGMG